MRQTGGANLADNASRQTGIKIIFLGLVSQKKITYLS